MNFACFTQEEFVEFSKLFVITDDKLEEMLTELILSIKKSFVSFVPKRLNSQINQSMGFLLCSQHKWICDRRADCKRYTWKAGWWKAIDQWCVICRRQIYKHVIVKILSNFAMLASTCCRQKAGGAITEDNGAKEGLNEKEPDIQTMYVWLLLCAVLYSFLYSFQVTFACSWFYSFA